MKKTILIPPLVFSLCILGIILLFIFLPEFNYLPYPLNLTGLLPVIAGFAFIVAAGGHFKKHNTSRSNGVTTYLIREGIYRYSRNPIYLGMLLILAGFCLLFPNVFNPVFLVLYFCYMNFYYIPLEEKYLSSLFSQEYKDFRKQVRRWI